MWLTRVVDVLFNDFGFGNWLLALVNLLFKGLYLVYQFEVLLSNVLDCFNLSIQHVFSGIHSTNDMLPRDESVNVIEVLQL